MPDAVIGRVYVDDLDDWDLPDKEFGWRDEQHENFFLNSDTGELTLKKGTPQGTYELNFEVTESSEYFDTHRVNALVTVVVKDIPREAIIKSGSFRLVGKTAEEYIQPQVHLANDKSLKDKAQVQLAHLANVSLENLDIVSILHSTHAEKNMLDIRYSAHGSPYRYPEELNTLMWMKPDKLDFVDSLYMVNVAECMFESVCPDYSCTNYLKVLEEPYVVNTNKTSFVGVSAMVEPKCSCNYKDNTAPVCLNGGVILENKLCSDCPAGFEGPHCEALSISFAGNGYSMYPPFQTCNESSLSLEIITSQENGLIFYVGPLRKNDKLPVRDFMSLELRDGYPVLLVDYGSGTAEVKQNLKKLNDGEKHIITVAFNTKNVRLNVDNCLSSDCHHVRGYKDMPGPNKALNVNGPLQLGGSIVDLELLGKQMAWNHSPTNIGFSGCISNLTYNDEVNNFYYLFKYDISAC